MAATGASILATPAVLPDCSIRNVPPALTSAQRMELVKVLAQEGPAGVEAWIKRQQQDTTIRRRVEQARANLEREARARKRTLEEDLERRRKEAATPWEQQQARLAEREQDLIRRLREGNLETKGTLDLAGALIRSAPPHDGSLWSRFTAWMLGLWVMLVAWWTRVVRRLRGHAPSSQGSGTVIRLDALDIARTHPELFAALRIQDGPGMRSRLRRAWKRLSGREDYAEALQRLAEKEAQAEQAKRQLDVQAEHDRLEDELQHLRDEEQAVRDRRRADDEAMERQHADAVAEAERDAIEQPFRRVSDDVLQEFREVGLVDAKGAPTQILLERFAGILESEAFATLPAGGMATPGHYTGGEGEYERGPLRSLDEVGAMELEGSLVQARTRHPHSRTIYDEDVLVHRELRATMAHVVVILDTSGSMEESGRLEAAKRVALVLHRAVRRMGPEHRVDLLTMSTSVARVDLGAIWSAQPSGFTNFGAALREARLLLESGGSDRRVVFLVTDGLPEAMTMPDGTDKADRPSACLPPAVEQSRRLAASGPVRLVIYQLEGKDPVYVQAAQQVARAGGGRVEVLDPQQLLTTLLVELDQAVR